MKVFIFILGLTVCTGSIFGGIKNGYENDIESNMTSLQRINSILSNDRDISPQKKREITLYMKKLVDIISYYELTEELINQLKTVSPGIYYELDSIRDKKGRLTDVYIKVIPREKTRINLEAASFFSQGSTDQDAVFSEFGEFSVSVDVWLGGRSLFLLCHELGHIKYVIPNLANYAKFYRRTYGGTSTELSDVGHNWRDQSGKLAHTFGRRLLEDQSKYKEACGKKPESAFAILHMIRMRNKVLLAQHGLPIPSGVVANSADRVSSDHRKP